MNYGFNPSSGSEKKMFDNVDGRQNAIDLEKRSEESLIFSNIMSPYIQNVT